MRAGWGLLGLLWAGPAMSQDHGEELTCESLMILIDTVGADATVDVIEGARPVRQATLRCLRKEEAPAQVVAAVERRLDKKIRSLDGDVAQVQVDDAYWPDSVGRKLADTVALASPGPRAFAVINGASTLDPAVHWWLVERLDKVVAITVEALPGTSTAAESPDVLGDQAQDLLGDDEAARFAAEKILMNKGYTRLLVLTPSVVGETRAVDLSFVVRDLDGEIERNGRLRVAPVADEGDVMVMTEVRPGTPEPGASAMFTVTLRYRDDDQPLIGRTVDVLADGEKLTTLHQVKAGVYEGPLLVPEDATSPWRLTWTYDTDGGDLLSTPLVIPLGGDSAMTFAADRARSGKRKASGAGLMATGVAALGAGVGLLVNGILWNSQLADASFDLTHDTYRQQTDAQMYGGAAAAAVGIGMMAGGGVMLAPQKGGATVAVAGRF